GLMSDPDTAALDPIFWLHHCNIDRLWEVWRQNPPTHVDPTESAWVSGPGSIGERIFSMPMPDGTSWDYKPVDMADLATLGYDYDDAAALGAGLPPARRIPRAAGEGAPTEGMRPVPGEKNIELIGANRGSLRITGDGTETSVQMDAGTRRKVAASI